MEKELKISVGNNKFTYGILRGSLKNPLIIFVHGFTGHKNEHQFFNAARFFEKGFSSFRFDLYSWKEDARKLWECTLTLHAKDLDSVIKYFREKGVKEIIVVGHSFGGLTILLSKNKDFNKAILWDPSHNPDAVTESEYVKDLDLYYKTWDTSFGFTLGKEMYEENKKLKPFELIAQLGKPVKIINAGAGELIEGGKEYFNSAKEPKALAVIPGATHCFDEYGTEEKLFEETLAWISPRE